MEKKMHKKNDSCLQISSVLLYAKKCSEIYAGPKDKPQPLQIEFTKRVLAHYKKNVPIILP